jgi:hypothetical protein
VHSSPGLVGHCIENLHPNLGGPFDFDFEVLGLSLEGSDSQEYNLILDLRVLRLDQMAY